MPVCAEAGKHYESRFPDHHGNVHSRKVDRPQILSTYFDRSNAVDIHNQSQQHDLALEECWVCTDPFFQLCTTMIGFVITDAWKLVRSHSMKQNCERIKDFLNRLAFAMLNKFDGNKVPPVDVIHLMETSNESSLSIESSTGSCTHTKEKLGVYVTEATVAT